MGNARTVLVVDDSEDIRLLVGCFLQMEGYNVLAAAHGAAALALLAEEWADGQKVPQVILLDMTMPVMDGWQFAAAYRAAYARPAPIVVMSAAGDLAQRGRDIGAESSIGKPFLLDDLKAQVERFCGSSAAR